MLPSLNESLNESVTNEHLHGSLVVGIGCLTLADRQKWMDEEFLPYKLLKDQPGKTPAYHPEIFVDVVCLITFR